MRWIFSIIGAVAVLAVLALVVFLMLPAERLARVAIDRLAAETGRSITIDGAERPVLWPDLQVSVTGLRVANPDWAGSSPMIDAETATLRMGWAALFGGNATVDQLDLDGARLRLVRGADGQLSWRNGDAALLPLALREARVMNSRLSYVDRAAGTAMDVRQVSATLDLNEGVRGSAGFSASGVVQGTVMEISGTIAHAARFFEGDRQPLRVDLLWNSGSLRFDGTAALGGGAEGALALRATDLAPLAELAGRELPAFLDRLSDDEAGINGTVTLAEGGSLHLREGVLSFGETQVNAALDFVPGEARPMVRGTITGGAVGLSDLFAESPTRQTEAAWSDMPYDISGLHTLDADLTVRAEHLSIGGLDLNGVDLRAGLDRGRLVLDIANIGVGDGQLAGEFVVNGRGGLSVGGDLLLANAQAAPLLDAVLDAAPISGRGSASIEFLAVGDDLFTLLDGLEAEGDVLISRGEMAGIDVAGLSRNAEALGDRTEFDRLVADFRVRSGILISEDMLLDAVAGTWIGAGRIDLAQRSMDYRLTPDAAGMVPVLVRGPWGEVQAEPDAEALAALQAAAASDRARAAEVARLLGGPLPPSDAALEADEEEEVTEE